MNTPQPNIQFAVERGWISIRPDAPKAKVAHSEYVAMRRAQFYARGLNHCGQKRTRARTMPAEIIAQAKRDGVGVTAIYNRLKRKGKMTL